jgi:hypothetical protein
MHLEVNTAVAGKHFVEGYGHVLRGHSVPVECILHASHFRSR